MNGDSNGPNNEQNNTPQDGDYIEINNSTILITALEATLVCMVDVIKMVGKITVGIVGIYLLYTLIGKNFFMWFVITPVIVAFFYYFFLCYDEISSQIFGDDDGGGDDGDADAENFEEQFNEKFNNKY